MKKNRTRKASPAKLQPLPPISARVTIGRYYGLAAAVLVILLVVELGYDITRPFNGLHSWKEASDAWRARSHVHYGLGYTKGLGTWALGDPPPAHPGRYLDHPQLPMLLDAAGMAIFGIHDWTGRLMNILSSATGLILLLLLLRHLLDNRTALLAGFLLVLFPITGYFGAGGWLFPVSMWGVWRYLQVTGQLPNAHPVKGRHWWELAAAIFLMVQLSWAGVFYTFAIGLDYVGRGIFRYQRIRPRILALLILVPLVSLSLNFLVMATGYEGDVNKIVALFKWRSAEGEQAQFRWGAWFARLGEYSLSNFTWPVLILLAGHAVYLLIGHGIRLLRKRPKQAPPLPHDFPKLGLFLLPGGLLLFVFKGLLWEHQYWMQPLIGFAAIAAACGAMLIVDELGRIHRAAGWISLLVILVITAGAGGKGQAAYRRILWQSPTTIELFQKLNRQIPPDQALLTYKDFLITQHPSKGSFYRPEYAWYLDREMVVAREPREIDGLAKTGNYPYYYIPAADQPGTPPPALRQRLSSLSTDDLFQWLRNSSEAAQRSLAAWELQRRHREDLIRYLKQRYLYEFFGDPENPGLRGNTPCYIFDLTPGPSQAPPALPNDHNPI